MQLPKGRIDPHDFMKLKPPTYNGTNKPNEPMLFLEEVKEIFISLSFLETQATYLIEFWLKGATWKWWRGYKKARDSILPPLTLTHFK